MCGREFKNDAGDTHVVKCKKSIDQGFVSAWSMIMASMILVCGQMGMLFLELA